MKPTILIVDDFASVRLYHTSFLTRKGYRCLGASGGEAALARMREDHVDLVLLDLVMPGMDGPALLDQLAADPGLARVPVLVITSESAEATATLSAAGRNVSVISKPVMPAALLQRVQELLPVPAPLPDGP